MGRFQPSPMISPSRTTTAPIGTSPSACARFASSSARAIYSSSFVTPRLSQMASPFQVRSFRFQWPADLATSWAFEMEALILGWYVLSATGSVQQLATLAALAWLGSLFSPFFGLAGDRIGHRAVLCITRSVYALLSAVMTALTLTGSLEPWHVFAIAAIAVLLRPSDMVMRSVLVGQT